MPILYKYLNDGYHRKKLITLYCRITLQTKKNDHFHQLKFPPSPSTLQ